MATRNKKYKIGLVLSGGGARGFAHVGALKALNEVGIYPEIISGVSAGAIAGALYADGHKPDEIMKMFSVTKFFKYIEIILPRRGLLKMEGLAKLISENLKAKTFEELAIPLIIDATDLNNGKCIYFNSGELLGRVLASATIPVMFCPVKMDNSTFVDGGVMDNFPVEPIENKCKFVIGVHVNPYGYMEGFGNLISVAERTFHLSFAAQLGEKIKKCDIFIEPPKLINYKLMDVSKIAEIYHLGYSETKKVLADNKEKITALLSR